jgi:hypothetical protein
MKLLTSLIGFASIALAVSLVLLFTGFVTLPIFLAVVMAWFLLVTVHSYSSPRSALMVPDEPRLRRETRQVGALAAR